MNFRKVWDQYLRLPAVFVGVCVVVLLLCGWLRATGKMQPVELRAYDFALSHGFQPKELSAANDIVVVGVDEDDLHLLNHYPLYDADKAALLDKLHALGAVAIGVDVFMDIPAGGDPQATKELEEALGKYRNVVAGYYVAHGDLAHPEVSPPMMLDARGERRMANRRVGFNDVRFDSGEMSRRGILYMTDEGNGDAPRNDANVTVAQSLGVGVANLFLEAGGTLKIDRNDPAHLRSYWPEKLKRFHSGDGGYAKADASGFEFLVDYRGAKSYRTVRLRQIIPELGRKALDDLPAARRLSPVGPETFAGKAVLIGMTATSIKDYIQTPLHPNPDLFGVYQHATLVDQLIRTARDGSVPLAVKSVRWTWGWTAIWTLLGAAAGLTARIGYSPRAPWRLLFIAVLGEVIIACIVALTFHHGTWIPLAPPSLCWLLALAGVGAYVAQLARADRNVLNHIFVRICQKEVAAELWKRRDEILEDGKLKPKKLTATLMFTDLKGFSAKCEVLEPGVIIEWLNRYHDSMTSIVTRYHGVVVRYMGDGMMAVFGAPCTHQDPEQHRLDALDAVNCALSMRQELATLHRDWSQRQLPLLPVRVGIQSGLVIEGSIGGASRFEYVTLGDTTNTAARLENYKKELMDPDISAGNCRILIGDATHAYVEGRVDTRPFHNLELEGMGKTINVYGVTGKSQPGPPSRRADVSVPDAIDTPITSPADAQAAVPAPLQN